MTARRRNEDSLRLYDFAKKYQENQNSSELIKKQNAAEEKVLSARLEHLNSRKELIKKTMEKEINLVKRKSSSGRVTSRKSMSSYQMDQASLPNTPSSTRGSRSGKFSRSLSLPQLRSASIDTTSLDCCDQIDLYAANVCRADVFALPTPLQHENAVYFSSDEEARFSFDETINRNSTRLGSLTGEHSRTEKQTRNSSLKSNRTKLFGVDSTLKSNFTNNATNMTEINGRQMNQNTCRIRSIYSQDSMGPRRQENIRTPTPFPTKENDESWINRSSVVADKLHNPLRYSRAMCDLGKLRLHNNMKHNYNPNGVAVKDLRFKKLESVLVPIKP